jgi:hypothetical protein
MTIAKHDPKVLGLISHAIRDAHLFDPDAGFGSTWNRRQLSGEEATHYAKAILNCLRAAGFEVSRQNDDPS